MSLVDLAAAEQQEKQAEWAGMTPIERLRRRLSDAQREVNAVEAEIAVMQGTCMHKWGEPFYDPYVRVAINTPLHNVIPEFRRDTWKRVCDSCGFVQETTEATEQTLKVPIFR